MPTVSIEDLYQVIGLKDVLLTLAQGEIFGWLNADDMYLPGGVSAAVARLRSGDYGLVYGGYRVVHENGETAFEVPPHPFDFDTLLDAKNFVPQPSTFFTREAYEAVGHPLRVGSPSAPRRWDR